MRADLRNPNTRSRARVLCQCGRGGGGGGKVRCQSLRNSLRRLRSSVQGRQSLRNSLRRIRSSVQGRQSLRNSLRRLRSLVQGRRSSPRSPRSARPKSSKSRFPANTQALQSFRTSSVAASQRTAEHCIASALRTWPLRGFERAPRRVVNRTFYASTASSQPPSNCMAVSPRSSAADYEKGPAVKE